MTTLTINGSTATGTGWTNPSNATGAADSTFATWVSKVRNATSSALQIAIPAQSIPDGSTIDSVQVTLKGYVSSTTLLDYVQSTLYDSASTAVSSTVSHTLTTTGTNVWAAYAATPTLTQLSGGLRLDVIADRSNNTTSTTVYIDSVAVEVVYTAAGTTFAATSTVAATSAAVGAVTETLVIGGTVAASSGATGDPVRAANILQAEGTVTCTTAATGEPNLHVWDLAYPSAFYPGNTYPSLASAASVTYAAAGTVASSTTVTGAVTASLATAGTTDSTTGVTGQVVALRPTTGSTDATTATSGDPTVLHYLTGTVTATSATVGAVIVQGAPVWPAEGTVSASTTATGDPTATHYIAGTVASSSDVSGTATLIGGVSTYPVAGTVTTTTTTSGAVTLLATATGTTGAMAATLGTVAAILSALATVDATTATTGDPTLDRAPVTWQAAGVVTLAVILAGTVRILEGTPDCRVRVIPAETRTRAIGADDRTRTIPFETRRRTVECPS